MNSPYGRRGQICAHFHWTWEYLNHGISYAEICRIMADLPKYNYDIKDDEKSAKTKKKEVIKLNDMNAEQIAELVKKLNR